MDYAIVECSQKASMKINSNPEQQVAPTYVNKSVNTKYPIDELEVGKAFLIPIADCKESAVRVLIATRGKKDGKKFCMLKHENYGVFEVARIG